MENTALSLYYLVIHELV